MNFDEIKELIEIFNESEASKLQITKEEFCIKLEKPTAALPVVAPLPAPVALPATPAPATSCATPTSPEAPKSSAPASGEAITSPMVGTFYRCPSPDSPAYVNVGDKVKKGQTLGIIEAMKIMNEIEAEFDCKILEIVPSDAQPVEYNSNLFIVERI